MSVEEEKKIRETIHRLWPPYQDNGIKQDSYDQLIELHNRLIQLRETRGLNSRDDILSRASVHEIAGNSKAAQYDYKYLINTMPEDSEAYSRAANLFYEACQLAEALEHVQKAIEYAFVKIYDIELRGKIFTAMGRHEEAKKDKQEVIAYHEQEAAKWDDPNHYYNYK